MSNSNAYSGLSSPVDALNSELVGKEVISFYGQRIGRIIGTGTDVDCTMESVSVDCGTEGVKQLPFALIIATSEDKDVIFIPKWRSDAVQLIARKTRIMERMKALKQLISEEDESTREDAASFIQRYDRKLQEMIEPEMSLVQTLDNRVKEIESDIRQIKLVLFEGTLLAKSNEINQNSYDQIKNHAILATSMLKNEKEEILDIKSKLESLKTKPINAVQSN